MERTAQKALLVLPSPSVCVGCVMRRQRQFTRATCSQTSTLVILPLEPLTKYVENPLGFDI